MAKKRVVVPADKAPELESRDGLGVGILQDKERDVLVAMFLYGQPDHSASHEDVETVVRWAEMTRIDNGMLDNVLSGSMMPVLDDGQVAFKLTKKGEHLAREMVSSVTPAQIKRPLSGEAFQDLETALAAISDTSTYNCAYDEGQRQIILMALHKLRKERPGLDYALGEIEKQLGGQIEWPSEPT